MGVRFASRPVPGLRILDFDIENRPLSYWVPDRPSAEITAIASCWADDPESMQVLLLGRETMPEVLAAFVERYNHAGLVTGHYIRKHDLPIINGALLEQGMPPLSEKLTHDTKLDLLIAKDMPVSQENLAAMLGVSLRKVHMLQADWREANRLTPEGLAKTEARVVGDVRQHMEMRLSLLRARLLRPPRVWRP